MLLEKMPTGRRISMGRPSHEPDTLDRRQVEALAGYGVPELGIDPKTLRKHYREELDFGHTKANAKVAENLYRIALGEGREAVTAAIFWLKTRAKWREPMSQEFTGQNGEPHQPITRIERTIISVPERKQSMDLATTNVRTAHE